MLRSPFPIVGAYVVKNFNFQGTLIYTKGAIVREPKGEVFYVLVSSKTSTYED